MSFTVGSPAQECIVEVLQAEAAPAFGGSLAQLGIWQLPERVDEVRRFARAALVSRTALACDWYPSFSKNSTACSKVMSPVCIRMPTT